MSTERYFILMNCPGLIALGSLEDIDQEMVLVETPPITKEEAEAIAAATSEESGNEDSINVWAVSESESRQDMVRHLVRRGKAAEVREALRDPSTNMGDLYYHLAAYAMRFAARNLHSQDTENQSPRPLVFQPTCPSGTERQSYFLTRFYSGYGGGRPDELMEEEVALVKIDDLTAEEAAAVLGAVELNDEDEFSHPGFSMEPESKVREQPGRHLMLCVQVRETLEKIRGKKRAELTEKCHRLSWIAIEAANEARRLREEVDKEMPSPWAGSEPQRFEVFDEGAAEFVVFDATDTEAWGPVSYGENWNGDYWDYQVEERLYRHRSGHWTLISESTHVEAPCSCGKRARSIDERESMIWLVRHGYSLPDNLENQANISFFNPGPPSGIVDVAAKLVPDGNGWFLFYRSSAAARAGYEAESGCQSSDKWNLFTYVNDLLSDETPVLLKALEDEFFGAVVDDGSIQGNLYEFEGRTEADVAQDTAEYIRARRTLQTLQNEYGGDEDFSVLDRTYWRLHKSASELAEQIRAIRGMVQSASLPSSEAEEANAGRDALGKTEEKPTWDQERRELWFRGTLCKSFRQPAKNQEAVLNAFQEAGWPPRMDDPIPPSLEVDPKERLAETCRSLRRNPLLEFERDGTGEAVLWSPKKLPQSPG